MADPQVRRTQQWLKGPPNILRILGGTPWCKYCKV